MENQNVVELIAAKAVNGSARMSFFPRKFGGLAFKAEALLYHWMGLLAKEYNGGCWEYFELSNGGFYMAPTGKGFEIHVDGNGFREDMSADASGIVATLFLLGQLVAETQGMEICNYLVDAYYDLRDYAAQHEEASKIYWAID